MESIVSVDERGQMVLPKDLRENAKIRPGDKPAVVRMEKDGSCCQSMCCGATDHPIQTLLGLYTTRPEEISKKVGYTEKELQAVPSGSNLGLGCGNPTALASIKEGETVLDFGSGAGFDCFLASNKVGPKGRVIGIDMTAEMVVRARANALKGCYENVEFRHGEIKKLPVEDNTIDSIISNYVINLVPDKERAFNEAFRVLKPGGRIMVSDIVLLRELPESAGFQDANIIEETVFPLDCVSNDPIRQSILESLKMPSEQIKKIENTIASIKVGGIKPG